MNDTIYAFLSSFFGIFGAYIEEYEVDNKKVFGNIRWKDEDEVQDFLWVIGLEESFLKKLRLLCEYLIKHNLIDGDKFIVTEYELQNRLIDLGWDLREARINIDCLCSVEVKMLDDGEETDSFFIHF